VKLAYVDTSCLVAIAFGERGTAALAGRLATFDVLAASDLLAAELRSAFLREGADDEPEMLAAISWIVPDRPLHAEITRVLDAGYVRGADCWHLAAALYLAEDPATISFLTLDERQGAVAAALGFRR
jgi:predicted nucleic acid-binding protein